MFTLSINQNTARRSHPACRAALVLTALFAPAVMAVEAKPDRIEFTGFSESATVSVTHNGTPVSAGDIKSVKLYVDQHDYDHMITVSKADGAVTVQPTEALELGRYDLAINTSHGEVRVPVTALQEIADEGLEARAKRQGVTVDEIRAQLGISQSVGQDRVQLDLSKLYYVGQTLALNLNVKPPRTGAWTVNGESVASPGGALSYTFEQPGVYDFAYVEREGDRTVAVGLATVTAAAEPVVHVITKPGTKQALVGPAGYGRYAWKMDGTEVGTDASWTGTFASSGEHRVTVRADSPLPETAQAFREVTFVVTVP